jgi:hypothetical protein
LTTAFQISGTDAELRVVERAAERQVDVDHAVAVGQQRHRELHRQAVGRARHLLAELQLVEHQLVGGRELAVGRDLVVDVHAHLAALDAVAGVAHRVRRQRRQVEVAHLGGDVEFERLGQRIELAGDFQRRGLLRLAAQFQVGQRRPAALALRRVRRERTELAGQLAQVGRVVGLDEQVGEVDLAVDQAHRAEVDDRAGPVSAGACAAGATGRGAGLAGSGLPPTMASADTGAPPERCRRRTRVVVVVPPGPFWVLASGGRCRGGRFGLPLSWSGSAG